MHAVSIELSKAVTLSVFRSFKVYRTSEPASSNGRDKQRFCKHAKRRNLRYFKVSRDENHLRENVMNSPSFEGFYAQSDCKLDFKKL